jgi:tetratricopeptide (TPR) repeat protein
MNVAGSRAALLLAMVTAGCTSAEPRSATRAHHAAATAEAAPNVAAALRSYERRLAAKHDEQREQQQYETALRHWQSGDAAGCQAMLEQVLRDNPQHRDAALLLAELHLWNMQPQQALQVLESLRAAHADDAPLNHTLGLAHDALGRAALARQFYQRAVELDPSNEVYLFSLDASRATTAPTVPQAPQRDNLVAQRMADSGAVVLAAHHSGAPQRRAGNPEARPLSADGNDNTPRAQRDAASPAGEIDHQPKVGDAPLCSTPGATNARQPDDEPSAAVAALALSDTDSAKDGLDSVVAPGLAMASEPALLPGLEALRGQRTDISTGRPPARKPLRLLR